MPITLETVAGEMVPDRARSRLVAILLFPEVEVLDFAGPFEVFSMAAESTEPAAFQVVTVAPGPILTVGGLRVTPDHDFTTCPPADVLLLPGGRGSRRAVEDPAILDWVAKQAKTAEIVASICTGALLLGRLGLLDGMRATTHAGALDLLTKIAPQATVIADSRYIDNGRILTSAGISAGIDMSLYLVSRLCGATVAQSVTHDMEYDWRVRAAG